MNLCAQINSSPIDSILPIVTKVNPKETDFDLDERRATLSAQLIQGLKSTDGNNPKLKLDSSNDPDLLDEQNKIREQLE